MDTYQAVYDAVRSRLCNGDIGHAIREAVGGNFDILPQIQAIVYEFNITAFEQRKPFVLMRPSLSRDGDQWCALYGDNLHDGVAGFGDTPEKAMVAFDVAWLNERTMKVKP